MKARKVRFDYNVAGELPSGCVHQSRVTRERAQYLLGHRTGKALAGIWRRDGMRVFPISGATAKELFAGYTYRNMTVAVIVERRAVRLTA